MGHLCSIARAAVSVMKGLSSMNTIYDYDDVYEYDDAYDNDVPNIRDCNYEYYDNDGRSRYFA